jgi:8-oxo-dGTP pyrophosphatase MutT (NUDIX family)
MSIYYKNKHILQCTNCGGTGHAFRSCVEPVSSYGVLIFRWISTSEPWPQLKEYSSDTSHTTGISNLIPQVLMIQRKDSLGFMDIMRGKYKLDEPDYIRKQLRGMTRDEREKLETMEFDEIWHLLWGSDTETSLRYAHDRTISKQKLGELRKGATLPSGESYTLIDLLRQEPILYDTPEWGFPKGRRDPHESDIHCAFRELSEETSIQEFELIKVNNVAPFIEQFHGSNGIHYRHTYYLALFTGKRHISFNALNTGMAREIGNLGWRTLDQAIKLLRPENLEKREILLRLSRLLHEYSPLLYSNLKAFRIPPGLDDSSYAKSENENTMEEQYGFTAITPGPISNQVGSTKRIFRTRQVTE